MGRILYFHIYAQSQASLYNNDDSGLFWWLFKKDLVENLFDIAESDEV